MIIYHSGGSDKDWRIALATRERDMLIYYSGGTHEKIRIPKLLNRAAIRLTFIDNIRSPEKVLLRIWKRRKRK